MKSIRYGLANLGLASLAVAIASAGAAQAQDPDQAPAYGSTTLRAGFADDPRSVAVQAGGAIDASNLSSNCWGNISYPPSYAVDYTAGGFDLFFSAASDADAVLAVRDPSGGWHCDDDGGEGAFNPGVEITDPDSGRYVIYVGTFSSVGYNPAMLHISEIGFFADNPFSQAPDPDLPPTYDMIRLREGFMPDPQTFDLQAGGDIEADRNPAGEWCAGYIAEAPDYVLDYDTSGGLPLHISMQSERDGTLAVAGPDGQWHCDDDSAGDLNPGVSIANPQSGRYAIWGGTYSDGPLSPATLYISELGWLGDEMQTLDWSAEPAIGTVELASGFIPDPHSVEVIAGGEVDVDQAGIGGSCWGYASVEPTYDLYYEAGDYDLYISSVSNAVDTVLIVNAPDGSWWCDDDSAGDLNSGITFDAPESGLYDIWVGTFGGGQGPATLHISELGYGEVVAAEPLDYTLESNYGGIALEAGFTPDPHTVDLAAGGPVSAEEAVDWSCRGYVTTQPDYELEYTAGDWELFISVTSEADTTLVVNDPNGEWHCNDDGAAGLNPGLTFSDPESGVYDIWVGTYMSGSPREAQLHISELGYPED